MVDSSKDTLAHMTRVRTLLTEIIVHLMNRARDHDASKLQSPEKEAFDRLLTSAAKHGEPRYGTKEYYDHLRILKGALANHYMKNRHHPEYHPSGIYGMNLLDLMEMLADWKAASERTNGSLENSLQVNINRFDIDDTLQQILQNTIDFLEW